MIERQYFRPIDDLDKFANLLKEAAEGTIEYIPIDYLLHDILILKAECLGDHKLLGYCEYLEKQLIKVKKGEAKIKV